MRTRIPRLPVVVLLIGVWAGLMTASGCTYVDPLKKDFNSIGVGAEKWVQDWAGKPERY